VSFLQHAALQRLLESFEHGRLAHAYLLSGPPGSGKVATAHALSARLLETDPDRVTEHPDFHAAEPESKSRRIVIEQIRRLEHALRSKPFAGARKVAVIHEADRLLPQAANAFLKTLEEPPAGSHIFLISSMPSALLETILSRCIPVQLQPGAGVPLSEIDRDLLDALETCLESRQSPVWSAFQFTRRFLELLGAQRDSIQEQFAEELKQDAVHYKQTTDGSWLEEREDQLKALSEATALRRRAEMLQTVTGWFADVLRLHHHMPPLHDRPAQRAVADHFPTRMLLAQLDALDELTRNLNTTMQEALALEAGFLKLFSAVPIADR
jgi:DNA polymerase-3 subunit delta'